MITELNIDGVTSYKSKSTLSLTNKTSLIYGLNGAGKSTISEFLYKQAEPRFAKCSLKTSQPCEILVYNQGFLKDYFYEEENLKGIFTLSKANKDAETKIANALKEIQRLESEKGIKSKELETESLSITQKQNTAKDTIWKIKTNYSGGDRVLEFCLKNLMGSKDSLFNHIIALPKPAVKPVETPVKPNPVVSTVVSETKVQTPTPPAPAAPPAPPTPPAPPAPKNVTLGGGVSWLRAPKVSFSGGELKASCSMVVAISANEQGKVIAADAKNSSCGPAVNRKVIAAVKRAQLTKYVENGVAYSTRVEQPFDFQLK